MRVFFAVLVLIFSFQTLTKADDVRDFEIEGMSIGDSALDFFNENKIKKNSMDYFTSKIFTPVQNDNENFFKIYDAVDFIFKTEDNNYKIYSLSGVLIYENNVEECYKKMDEIVLEMDSIFPNVKKYPKETYKHGNTKLDTSGKSIVTEVSYEFKNGDSVAIACYDYSKEHGSQDHLSVALDTKEIYDFLVNEAYN